MILSSVKDHVAPRDQALSNLDMRVVDGDGPWCVSVCRSLMVVFSENIVSMVRSRLSMLYMIMYIV